MSLEALRTKIGTLSLEAQKRLEEDVQKAEQKAEKKADAAMKKLQVRVMKPHEPRSQSARGPYFRFRHRNRK